MPLMWASLMIGAVLAGAAVVAVMVARPALEPAFALAGVLGMGGSTFCLFRIAITYRTGEPALWAFAFVLAGTAGGYALASTLLHALARHRPLSPLPSALPDDPGAPAILVVACTEPEHYEPAATARMFEALASEGLLEASIGFLPFLFFAQKTRYRAVGGINPAYQQLTAVSERLEKTIKRARVSPVLCSGPHSLEAAVLQAVREGHRTVVVAELSVGESLILAGAKQALSNLRMSERGVSVTHTGVLWCSERVIGMLAARVMRSATDVATTGVVLVGHGQPDEIASKNPQMDIDETAFLSRLRMTLLDTGLQEANVRVAWADWGEPGVTTTVRHLVALGCTRVIVEPAAFPLDTIGTRLDLEVAVRQARVQENATMVTLPAWRDDPAVIEELRSRVVDALAEHSV
jgi:protoheme ferro-lyase